MMNILIKIQNYFVPMFQQLQIALFFFSRKGKRACIFIDSENAFTQSRFMIYVCGNAVKNFKEGEIRRYGECR